LAYDSEEGTYFGNETYSGEDFVMDILSYEAKVDNKLLIQDIQSVASDTEFHVIKVPYNNLINDNFTAELICLDKKRSRGLRYLYF